MARGKQRRVEKPASRRPLPRKVREGRLERLITVIGVSAIFFSTLLVATGYYFSEYRPYHQIAMKINDTRFDMRYYVGALRFYGVSADAVTLIKEAELIRQAAEKLGVSVSDQEVREELKRKNLPLGSAPLAMFKPQLLTLKLLEGYFEEKTPLSALQRETQAMFLESEGQARDVKKRLDAGEDFGKLAEELSLDIATKPQKGSLGWHPGEVLNSVSGSKVFSDYIFKAPLGAVGEPLPDADKYKSLGYWLIKILERRDSEVGIQEMLLSSEAEARGIRERLDASEDFAELAKKYSQAAGTRENGGEVGFLPKGARSKAFENYVFDPNVKEGALSQPIRDEEMLTSGGYWLIKVLGEDKDRLLSNDDRKQLKRQSYQNWVSALMDDSNGKIEVLLTEEMKEWAKERAKKG